MSSVFTSYMILGILSSRLRKREGTLKNNHWRGGTADLMSFR